MSACRYRRRPRTGGSKSLSTNGPKHISRRSVSATGFATPTAALTRPRSCDDVRFADVHSLPGIRVHLLLVDPLMDGKKGAAASEQLRVLRRMESFLCLAAHGDHGFRLVRCALDGPCRDAFAKKAHPCRVDHDQPLGFGILQVCAVPDGHGRPAPAGRRGGLQAHYTRDPVARRHIVLHLREPFLCHRRVPSTHSGLEEPARLQSLCDVLPPPRCRTNIALW